MSNPAGKSANSLVVTTDAEAFSARRYYAELCLGSHNPSGLESRKLPIHSTGLHTYKEPNASLVWIDGIYADTRRLESFIQAIQTGELPIPLLSGNSHTLRAHTIHSDPRVIRDHKGTLLSVLDLVESIVHVAINQQRSFCPKCKITLNSISTPSSLLKAIFIDFENTRIEISASSERFDMRQWADERGLSVTTDKHGGISIPVDTDICSLELLSRMNIIIGSLWRIPGILISVKSAVETKYYTPLGWCSECLSPGTKPIADRLRAVLNRPIDLNSEQSIELEQPITAALTVKQLLTQTVGELLLSRAFTEEHPLFKVAEILNAVTLGHISLGMPALALTDSEVARLSIAKSLIAARPAGTLIIIDIPPDAIEPSYRSDIKKTLELYSRANCITLLGEPFQTAQEPSIAGDIFPRYGVNAHILGDALGITPKLAELYSASLDARSQGLRARDFTFGTPRSNPYICTECRGLGVVLTPLPQLMRPQAAPCRLCEGARFKSPVARALFRGVSYSNLLNQPLIKSAPILSALSKIKQRLEKATELGLTELPLGMPIALLSLSEQRRLKLIDIRS